MNKTAKQQGKGITVASIVLMRFAVIFSLVASVTPLLAAPQFRKVFEEQSIELPPVSAILYSIPGIVYLALFLAVCAGLIIKEWLIRNKGITLAVNIIVAFLITGFHGLYVIILFLPLSLFLDSVG